MINFEQDLPVIKVKKHIPLSATLIASVLLALNPKEQVVAQEIEEKNTEIEMNNVFEKYHSLLDEVNQDNTKQGSFDLDSESRRELNVEEVKAIQDQLILFIEKEGNSAVTEAMKEEVSTLAELEELFASLLGVPVIEADDIEVVEESIEDSESIEETEEVEEAIEVSESTEETVEVEEANEEELVAEEESAKIEVTQLVNFSLKTTAEKSVSYTVRAGDTLNKIAREHSVTVDHLAKLNNISNINIIRVGQILAIHGSKVENMPAENLENLDKTMTNDEFIEYLAGHASVAAKEQNLYASVMIAQAALESGFGTSGLSSSPNHNLYGMKGTYEGESVIMRTREYSTAKGWHYVNAHFKKYPSYLESLLDHAAYIRRGPSWGPEFYSGVWVENTERYQDATSWLQGRYATDPAYASKLNRIIESYNLTRFDAIGEDDLVVQPPTNNTRPEQDVKPSTGDKEADSTPGDTDLSNYRVESGDTLSHIALDYKMSVRELKELNNLKSDLIFVGQNLKVKKAVVESKPTPTPTPESLSTDTTSYTVKRGDTLSHIALRYKMSVRELKELNNLRSDLILVGQQLKINQADKGGSTKNVQSYQIKAGDTLSAIARRFNTTVQKLKETNKLQSDLIYVNQRLTI